MTDATRAEMQRALAQEFECHGWEYDMSVGPDIVGELEQIGSADPKALAARVSGTWLERNRTTREAVAGAIERAVGGRRLVPARSSDVTLNFDNRSYTLTLESGSEITGSQVNVGGTQINVQAAAGKDEILVAVAVLLRAGLGGDWNPDAAADLAQAIEARDNIGFDDVRGIAIEVAQETDEPDQGRVREMLQSIAEKGIGGALGTGISAGFGWLLQNPPI